MPNSSWTLHMKTIGYIGYIGVETPPKDYTKPRQTIQSPDRQYKAPTDFTKPRQTTQSPNRLYKAPKQHTKHSKNMQSPKILDNNHKYLTIVATNINLT